MLTASAETFQPFEPMRVGVHHIVEALCALGYGRDARVERAWQCLRRHEDADGRMRMTQTLTRSYLPREKAGAPSKWVTLYTLLAEKESGVSHEKA